MSEAPVPFAIGTLPRRPPFGDNPDVGTRGTRTQQRILRAALELFDEVGYHDCGVDRITARARCSRPSFYQYFSSKEDLFRHLSGDLGHRMLDIAGADERITPDTDGWRTIRSFIAAYGELYDVYAPLFAVFSTAVATDNLVATGAARVVHRQALGLLGRVDRDTLRSRRAEDVAALLLNGVSRAQRYRQVITQGNAAGLDRGRVEDALADVLHRTFFGPLAGVNIRGHVPMVATPSATAAPLSPVPTGLIDGLGQAGRRTRSRLLEAGREVFVARGYHEARVDDVVELAETSHGTFYRYFDNKQELFRILAARSGRRIVTAVEDLPPAAPDPDGAPAGRELRQWLRYFLRIHAAEGPIIRAWVEAMWVEPELRAASQMEAEELRRRLARFLAPRRFGDIDADALVLMALLDRSEPLVEASMLDEAALVEAFALVIQRGLLPAQKG